MSPNEAERLVPSAWRTASFCASGECVEVAQGDGVVILRDSTQPSGRRLYYATEEWRPFVRHVKAGTLKIRRS